MPRFLYKAIDSEGKQSLDTLSASSRATALDMLSQQGLIPISVEEKTETEITRTGFIVRSKRVSKNSVQSFILGLSNLLAAGVPLSRALKILSREAAQPAARKQWMAIHDDVANGMSMADALSQWPRSFSSVYVAMVRAGETGGFLDLVLGQIANFRTREDDLMGKVKAASIYPIILAVLAIGILGFLLTYFIPRFSSIFQEFGGALPGLTRAIVSASNALIHYWLIILMALVMTIVGIKRILSSKEGKLFLERIIIGLPMLGKSVSRFALVRFCRMLGTLVGAGVPLVTALRVAREAIGNQILAETVNEAIEDVQQGAPLARSLAKCRQLFPAAVIEMVSVAEESSRLDKELVRLATAYEQELDHDLRMMVSLLEPALLFVMAVLVGTVVIGMLLPIFNLQELIR